MKKKWFICLSLSLLFILGALHAEETKEPFIRLKENGKHVVIASLSVFASEAEPLKLFFYGFNSKSNMPIAYEFDMIYDAGKKNYSATIQMPYGCLFGIARIGDGYKFHSQIWEFMAIGSDGLPLKSAYLKAGLSYMGNMPENMGRYADLNKAVDYLKKETELYPDNIQAEIGLASLKFDLRASTKEEFEAGLKNALGKKADFNDENDVRSVSRALKILNRNEDAEKIEMDFAVKNASSELAEEMYISGLAKAKSRSEFSDGILDFLKKYPSSSSRGRLFTALTSAYLQNHAYKELRLILDSLKDIPSSVYTQLAFEAAENEKLLKGSTLEQRIEEALKLMDLAKAEGVGDALSFKPQYLSNTEWKIQREENRGVILEAYGKIYLTAKNYAKAAENFTAAKNILKDGSSAILFESLTQAYNEAGLFDDAFKIAGEAILNTKATTLINELYPVLFKKIRGDSADFSKSFDSLLVKAKEKRIEKLKRDKLNLTLNLGVIETLNGIKIDLNFIKGKGIILCFWASWCGPCADAMDSFNELYGYYNANDDLLFAAINVWEKGEDRAAAAQEFIEKGSYDMPVYLDKADILPRKLGIMGLPTIIFIDKEGLVQFKEDGFTNDDNFIRESSDKIEVLLSK